MKLTRPMRIAVDCGNGVAGAFAPTLFRSIGCDVVELFCDVDGTFPNHHPDPSQPKNLVDLIDAAAARATASSASPSTATAIGSASSPATGHVIYPDRQLMLFAADVLSRVPGATIIYDVKSTRNLKPWITRHGGVPLLWKTGHSLIKAKMKEIGAALAGEMSGHTFFGERWYGFDDGLYAGARLLEIVSREKRSVGAARGAARRGLHARAQHPVRRRRGARAGRAASPRRETFPGASEVIRIDGLRVEYPDGFGLARASNTTPVVVLRFEADDAAALARIQSEFRKVLARAKPGAALPF